MIDGRLHHICYGVSHPEPTWLPATEKYFYVIKSGERAGQLFSRCRVCELWSKVKVPNTVHGLVPAEEARPYYIEAANRIGMAELARRTGLNLDGLSQVIRGRRQNVRAGNFRLVMLEVVSIRRKDEHSIPWQSQWRVARRGNGYGPRCVGCGCDIEIFTEGCNSCTERRLARAKRERERERNGQSPSGSDHEQPSGDGHVHRSSRPGLLGPASVPGHVSGRHKRGRNR